MGFLRAEDERRHIEDNIFIQAYRRADEHVVGELLAQRRYASDLWAVADIWVEESERRKGLGTALYEYAARLAALKGGRLMSDSRQTEMSIGFWNKQARKGRVEPIDIESLMPSVEPLVLKPGVRSLKNNPPGDPRGFPWPKKAPVYHATTAMRAILDHGFKTRRERGGAHALGGGTDAAVSFTLDRRTAISIALGLRTIRGITRGEIGLGDLIIQAEQVAPGLYDQVRKNLEVEMHAVTPEDVARIDRGMRWFHSSILGGDLEKSTAEPFIKQGLIEVIIDHGYGVSGWIPGELFAQLLNEDNRRNHERRRPGTEFNNDALRDWTKYGQYRSRIVQAYKTFLHFGGWDGDDNGSRKFYNPLFFMTSLGPVAALDDRDIGVLKAHLDADWFCADYWRAEESGHEPPADRVAMSDWSHGCEVELDRGRYGDESQGPKTRSEYSYRHTLPRGWEPPDPSDTVALMSSMAEVRVWNTKLIRDVEETENLDDVLNYARDAWDREGLVVDEPYWMPFHRDELPRLR
jgi:GNAT superfamily N-acetyltransferase